MVVGRSWPPKQMRRFHPEQTPAGRLGLAAKKFSLVLRLFNRCLGLVFPVVLVRRFGSVG